jgi:alpha-mannosidase
MYGTDHAAPVPELAGLVSRLNELEADARIRISTLTDYMAATGSLDDGALEWHGEMRSGARANVLMGVASARIDLKAACGRAERLLERYAEPLTALWAPDTAWPEAYLRLAWRRVIENSAHDSICGCSVDAVVDQVLVRFAEAEQLAGLLTQRAVAGIAASAPRTQIVAVNPSPFARVDEVSFDASLPDAWDEVALELPDGSRAATQLIERETPLLFAQEVRASEFATIWRRFHGREIFDRSWNGYLLDEVRGQPRITFDVDVQPDPVTLDVEALRTEVEAAVGADPDASWHVRIVARPRRRLLARVPVPALGWATARPVEGAATVTDPVRIDDDERGLRNAALAVHVARDGTLRLEAADGTRIEGVGRIVDGGDFGDSYNYGPPARDTLIDTPHAVTVRIVERGPLRASLAIERSYDWPEGLVADGTARSAVTHATTITTHVELRSGEPFVRVTLDFENRSVDHRVRFHVPTARAAQVSHAEGQFAVVERGTAPEGGYHEMPLATYPARGFVDAGGVAVLLDHLVEYELLDAAAGGELAITVLRAIGLISRNANPYREDPAGPEIAIPGAQCRGPWRVAFALYPHAGSWTDADVLGMAERYQHRFASASGTRHDSDEALVAEAGLELRGAGVVMSSLRRRNDGWIELRLVNASDAPVEASLRGRLREAREVSIIGRSGNRIGLATEVLRLALTPWEIRTVQVRRDEPELTSADVLDTVGARLAR